MPTLACPACGREIQFPDYFYGTRVNCPAAGCGRPVQLPNADGTVPVKPTGMLFEPTPVPAAEYFLRKPFEPDLVVGPLPRERLRQMALAGKLRPIDELSEDRRKWRPAKSRDPALFERDGTCRTCGAIIPGGGDVCPACAEAVDEPGGAYTVGKADLQVRLLSGRVERRFTAPRPLFDFASARFADAIVGAAAGGWLGLWTTADDQPTKTWEFDPASDIRIAVADRGGRAVLATGDDRHTRIYVADFEYRKLRGVADIDGGIRALNIDPEGEYVGLVDDQPDVRIYRVESWKRVDRFPVRGSVFELNMAGDRLAAANREGRLALYDLRTGRVARELAAPKRDFACPQRPLRMTFSSGGKHVLAAAGLVVKWPRERIDGINPNTAFWLGFAAGGVLGGVATSAINFHVPDIWRNIRDSKVAGLMQDLYDQTAIRVWETAGGGLMADFWNVFAWHPTGLADAFYSPRGAIATAGEKEVHAFDLAARHYGPIYEVTDAAEIHRAQAVQPDRASLIRRVDFTHDGEHALVLVAGDWHIRQVPWPAGCGDDSLLDPVQSK
jgi:hypothetical protein